MSVTGTLIVLVALLVFVRWAWLRLEEYFSDRREYRDKRTKSQLQVMRSKVQVMRREIASKDHALDVCAREIRDAVLALDRAEREGIERNAEVRVLRQELWASRRLCAGALRSESTSEQEEVVVDEPPVLGVDASNVVLLPSTTSVLRQVL